MKNVSTKVVLAVACVWGVSISNAALMPLGGEYPLLGDIEGHQSNPSCGRGFGRRICGVAKCNPKQW